MLFVLPLLLVAACAEPAAAPAEPAEPAAQEAAPADPPAAPAAEPVAPRNIPPQELAARLQEDDRPFLLDVRQPEEAEIASIPGTSTQIPLGQLPSRLNELDPTQEIVVYCRSGSRSSQAVQMLHNAGFTNVHNLEGGTNNWAAQVDPSMTRY
jgi:adenylyltransferase/sulfurtransferase